jgi:hypothetical protein
LKHYWTNRVPCLPGGENIHNIFKNFSVFLAHNHILQKAPTKDHQILQRKPPGPSQKKFAHGVYKNMKTFLNWLAEDEIVGIYPPEYGGIGTHPPLANQTGSDQVYVKASRNSLKGKKGKNPYKKMPPA